jgi:hypothetical protein
MTRLVVPFGIALTALASSPAAGLCAGEAPPRLPVPGEAAQKKSSAAIREVHRAEFEGARTPQGLRALARKLFQEANESHGDPIARYALYTVARDLSLEAGDVPLALEAIDGLAVAYEVDLFKLKLEALTRGSRLLKTDDDRTAAGKKALEVLEAALLAESFTAARGVGEAAVNLARKSTDPLLAKRAAARSAEVPQAEKLSLEARKAAQVLEKEPGQPEASLALGRFRCFLKGEWEAGLKLLASGSDPALKARAEEEGRKPTAPAAQVVLGDNWWERGEKEEGLVKRRVRERAARWYREAVPSLSGLEKARVEARLREVEGDQDAEPRIVAVWKHSAGRDPGHEVKLYSNGRIDAPDGRNTWSLSGSILLLNWADARAPGGKWIDRCNLSPDRRRYSGKNQRNVPIQGELVDGGI